ncbi:hypothetical protein BASA83_011706 [Batrachochytrium salamandrivorans]|nr:hypothetical protein BASA83_011706 [Batrachochytrium salamandrivorans]
MISLVQVLVTAVLVPVACNCFIYFQAAGPTPTHAAPAAATTSPAARLPVSPDGQCGGGSGFGCKLGFCCSKHNYCGSTNEHCGLGCQPDVALCDPLSPLTGLKVSPDGTCGRGTNFKCGKGQCCSQYNRCGTTEKHCGTDCQMAYGTCNPLSAFQKLPLTSDGQCGKEANAKCEEGQCCSDNNYCGTTKDYCDAGCQSGYGVCNPLSRPQGKEYCGFGCQPLFGTCNPTSSAKLSSAKSGSGKRKHGGSGKPRSKKRKPGQHNNRKVKKDRRKSDKHVCIGLCFVFWYLVTTLHRIQSGLLPAIQKSRLRLLGRSTRSGCGECIYLAPRWSLKWRSRPGPVVGWMGTVEHESMGTRHDNRALAARLADFLQVAYQQYQFTLWHNVTRDCLVEIG